VPALILPASPVDLSPAPSAPMWIVVDSGPRAIVEAVVEGVRVRMLVHANAGFTVMLTHDALRRISGTSVDKETEFGLDHDLRVSELGRGSTALSSLEVAGSRLTDVPCAVFQLPTTNWDGMLGVDWLDAVRPVVDFGARTLAFPGDQIRAHLREEAGRVELALDAELGRYVGDFLVDGEPATFVVSTAGDTILDLEYARERGLDLTAPVAEDHGPWGAVVPVFRTVRPVRLEVADRVLTTASVQVHDIHAYRGEERQAGGRSIAGYLAADVLLANDAVLDFERR
jgi:hypothetical protein